jgi:release factor glutamine methyltransferase
MVRAAAHVPSRDGGKHWSALRSIYRAALRIRLRLWVRNRNRGRFEILDGMQLVILPGVFDGVLLRTGTFLATALTPRLIPQGTHVLDLGTGSGINGLFAARHGARVVATDINPEAVRCAQVNALVNHLESQIETRVGDLFVPVSSERFDIVLFNPPYYRGRPRDLTDAAWRGVDVFDRFLRDLPLHLTADGRALVVLSTDADIGDALWDANDLTISVVRQHDFVNETLTVYEIACAEEQA